MIFTGHLLKILTIKNITTILKRYTKMGRCIAEQQQEAFEGSHGKNSQIFGGIIFCSS